MLTDFAEQTILSITPRDDLYTHFSVLSGEKQNDLSHLRGPNTFRIRPSLLIIIRIRIYVGFQFTKMSTNAEWMLSGWSTFPLYHSLFDIYMPAKYYIFHRWRLIVCSPDPIVVVGRWKKKSS